MARPRHWQLAPVIIVVIGILATALAIDDGKTRGGVRSGHHLHAGLRARLGFEAPLEPTVTPPAPRSMMRGGRMMSHLAGANDGRAAAGSGGGRTIYTGATAFEPTMGIDSNANIFYQGAGYIFGGSAPIVSVSHDGGRSWDEVTPQMHPHTFDPMLYVDTRTERVFTADLSGFECTTVSHSDDVGESWTTSEACGLSDHQNVFAGPPVTSSTVDYPNIVYMCAIDTGFGNPWSAVTSCLKSLDGGLTWVRTGAPAYTADPRREDGNFGIPGFCDGDTGHGFVDSDGTVYLPRGWCGQPYLAISKNEGATWERMQVAGNGMPRTHDESAQFEHEAAVAVDAKGNIYYFWTARNRLPYIAVSSDKGKTFSKPMMVGPPGLKEAWGPTIDVGDVGKIALGYVGSTNAPGGKSPDGVGEEYDYLVTWNGYITTSVNALSRQPRFFSASVNRRSDPLLRGECGVVRCDVVYDFIDVVIGPDGRPWTSMVDGCPPPGDTCEIDPGLGFVGTVVGGPRLR